MTPVLLTLALACQSPGCPDVSKKALDLTEQVSEIVRASTAAEEEGIPARDTETVELHEKAIALGTKAAECTKGALPYSKVVPPPVCEGYSEGPLTGEGLLVLVNKDEGNRLRADYAPQDLEKVPAQYLVPGVEPQKLRKDTVAALTALENAAAAKGYGFYVKSGYRSFVDQCETFRSKIAKWQSRLEHSADDSGKGLAYARKSSAEPGRSQHQLGTTLDLTVASQGYKFLFAMEKTPEIEWLKDHAHEFGFVMSYPFADDDHDGEGYNHLTGYYYEPWHWRYVGVSAATEIHDAGILLDDYLRDCAKGAQSRYKCK